VPIVMFVILLFFVLVSMSIFRSPAVALMPDVTIKPLRSKANAVINLMGAGGGLLAIVVGILFGTDKTSYMTYTWYFAAIAALMLVFLGIFLFKVKEPRLLEEVEQEKKKYGLTDEEEEGKEGSEKLSGGKLRSLLFLLASVFLWFTAYNAVTSKFSVYAGNVLNMGYNLPLLIAQGVAIAAFIPIGIIASKIGRKKSIIAGIIILTVGFTGAYFVTPKTTYFMYAIFILAGIGWATINVNSYPMVVEMSKGTNIGRYTGFYYTASMAAQIITPILSGFLMDMTSMRVLFPYATLFSILALITMLFVMHGDNKPTSKVGIEIYDND
jgi:maltose/moltooligosaccharide transporter